MRALVFGGTGMLGKAVAAHWRRRGDAVLALSRDQADLRDRDRLVEWAETFRPQCVINCAAFTQVDACETERELACEINGRAVANAVAAARRVDAPLVHISSDYVFPGTADEPILEEAPTDPKSVYGESKLLGEQEALRYDDALVVRASWLFGPGGPNFAKTIAGLLRSGRTPLRVVDDQVGRPTYTPFLARAIHDALASGLRGILHYGNRDAVSWYGFAREIGRVVAPKLDIQPCTTAEFPRPAPRPAYSVLDVNRFEDAVGRRVEPWIAGLWAYLDSPGEVS